jgi:hypothetical protein
MAINIAELTDDELRQLEDRLRRLPPEKPPEPCAPYDYSAKACALDPRAPWVQALLKANAEAGVDASMRAELADRLRRKG